MITQLYDFAPGSYVVADEWNGNFSALYKTNVFHAEEVQYFRDNLAFTTALLSPEIYEVAASFPNSRLIEGLDVFLYPGQEYYKNLPAGSQLRIFPTEDFYGEARILVNVQEQRVGEANKPFVFMESSNIQGSFYMGYNDDLNFIPGYYYIMAFGYDELVEEHTTRHFVKLKVIWTGV